MGLKKEIAILDKKGVVHSVRNESDLDEAPSAYKDINIVMDNQTDLAEIVVELTPLAVLKG
ncbi:MAG: RtcB family protein [Flavobacteriales bacterium]|nr:RtcB family protein [Flavobacteriales bacterium]